MDVLYLYSIHNSVVPSKAVWEMSVHPKGLEVSLVGLTMGLWL